MSQSQRFTVSLPPEVAAIIKSRGFMSVAERLRVLAIEYAEHQLLKDRKRRQPVLEDGAPMTRHRILEWMSGLWEANHPERFRQLDRVLASPVEEQRQAGLEWQAHVESLVDA